MPLTATGMRTVLRQVHEIKDNPVDGIRLAPYEDLNELHFHLDGPVGTPYAAGRFHVLLVFDEGYPEAPPKGYFRTKVFHPNVSDRGDICVNALKRDWNPSLGLRHVLLVIRCLLIEPNPESALNEEAGRLLLEDYAAFEKKAFMYTCVHAKRTATTPRYDADLPDGNVSRAPAALVSGGQPASSSPTALRTIGENSCPTQGKKEGSAMGAGAREAPSSGMAVGVKKKAIDKQKAALKRI